MSFCWLMAIDLVRTSQRSAVASGTVDALADMRTHGYEKLVVCNDNQVGLQAIICIHSTLLGPANGGVRMRPYPTLDSALADVMRLARLMTYKWAGAGEHRGGGKSIIIGDPARDKTEPLLRTFGRFVDEMGGEYYVGEDAGITLADMETIHLETDFVATLPVEAGGLGDIAVPTARGVLAAMRACATRVWGSGELEGRSVAVQGAGAVGSAALRLLLEQGAQVYVADPDGDRLAAVADLRGVEAVTPDELWDVDVDIFAPFAFGPVITADTLGRLRARIVAGSANDLFADDECALELEHRGIVYAPDIIASAGGAIYDGGQFRKGGFNQDRVNRKIDQIFDRVTDCFERAQQAGVSCQRAAYEMAEARLNALAPLRRGRGQAARGAR